MNIDDPIKAARAQVAADEYPVPIELGGKIANLISRAGPAGQLIGVALNAALAKKKEENQDYFIEVLLEEVPRLNHQLVHISEEHKRFVTEQLPGVILEGVRRARETRASGRIRRMALIVANSAAFGPNESADKADEMLRIAGDLSDTDVWVLSELHRVQAPILKQYSYLPERDPVNDTWKVLQSENSFFNGAEIHGICSKLQSYGLVARADRKPRVVDLVSAPCGILPNGVAFVEYIREYAAEAAL